MRDCSLFWIAKCKQLYLYYMFINFEFLNHFFFIQNSPQTFLLTPLSLNSVRTTPTCVPPPFFSAACSYLHVELWNLLHAMWWQSDHNITPQMLGAVFKPCEQRQSSGSGSNPEAASIKHWSPTPLTNSGLIKRNISSLVKNSSHKIKRSPPSVQWKQDYLALREVGRVW